MAVLLAQHTLSKLFRLTLYTFIGTFDVNIDVAAMHARNKLVFCYKIVTALLEYFAKW